MEPVNLRALNTINTRYWQLASMANKTLYKNILQPLKSMQLKIKLINLL